MADKVKQIKEQMKFCKELMLRLDKAVCEKYCSLCGAKMDGGAE